MSGILLSLSFKETNILHFSQSLQLRLQCKSGKEPATNLHRETMKVLESLSLNLKCECWTRDKDIITLIIDKETKKNGGFSPDQIHLLIQLIFFVFLLNLKEKKIPE